MGILRAGGRRREDKEDGGGLEAGEEARGFEKEGGEAPLSWPMCLTAADFVWLVQA